MNRRTCISGWLVISVALVLGGCNSRSEPDVICNASDIAVNSFDNQANYSREKAKELLNALDEYTKEPGKHEVAQPYYDQGIAVKKAADSFLNYADTVLSVIRRAGRYPINEEQEKMMPHAVRARLDVAYAKMMAMQTGNHKIQLMEERFLQDFRDTAGWEERMFGNGVTKCMAIMNLSRIKATVAAMEEFHQRQIFESSRGGSGFRVAQFEAVAFPRSAYLLVGDKSEASVLFVDKNLLDNYKQSISDIIVDGGRMPVNNALYNFAYTETVPGLHTHHGKLILNLEQGKVVRDFKWETFVFTPAAHVSYDKPITFEAGKAEALTINTEYAPTKDIAVSLSRGSINGKDGHYTIKVDEPGSVKLTVAYKKDGQIHAIDSFSYQVK